jgi:hypothetical protein
VATLLPGLGSVSLADTLAELVKVPVVEVPTATTIVIVAWLPLAIVPRLQEIVPMPLQPPPWLTVAETKLTPGGRVSSTVTPVAVEGPLLMMVRV